MNKFFAKLANKKSAIVTLAVTLVLIVASILVSVFVGVNYGAGLDDRKTVSVSIDTFYYNTERDTIEDTCEKIFEKMGVDTDEVYRAEKGVTSEIVYVLDSDVSETKLTEVKNAVAAQLNADTANDKSPIYGAVVSVTANAETSTSKIGCERVWRAAIVVGVFAILACAYVWIRYRLGLGLVALLLPILTVALTAAIVLLVRIPVTNATFYAALVAALIASAFEMIFLAKLDENKQADAYANATAEELVKGSLATKWIGWTTVALAVAFVLVGAIATTAVRYFALASIVGLAVAAVMGLVFVPSACLTVQAYLQKKAAGKTASGYVGAKKANAETKDKADEASEEQA